ncbi:MAG: filamentous hemagglutinin N-terminal domain-containing protein [Nitrospinae bacterium]|nr:filamentous hemagglutinin N-terminal domain-containing protein [Nitrospinota bacterium]
MNTIIKTYLSVLGVALITVGSFTNCFALPKGGNIVSGTGTIQQTDPNCVVINQSSNRLITNWNSFNIGTLETVTFNQPSVNAVSLNRITGVGSSSIFGTLTANGQVFISNPSGIIFGKNSRVDVGGLLATTLDISNQDFLNGNYRFTQNAETPLSSIINMGNITAKDGGFVGILAPAVENKGYISANLGSVALASGEEAVMNFTEDGRINFSLTKAVNGDVLDAEGNAISNRVLNSGKIASNGGQVILSAKDAGDVMKNVVNNTGVIEAQTVQQKEGKIFLLGNEKGIVRNSGTLDASGNEDGEKGGHVQVTGEYVGLFGKSIINASGDTGGGNVYIGGGFQGKDENIPNAFRTFVSNESEISADAKTNGNGGNVIVWADDTTRFYGKVSAQGGNKSGDGGFVEVSGKNNLDYMGNVNTLAINGKTGSLLLDPGNVFIDDGGTNTIQEANSFTSPGDILKIAPSSINSSQTNVVIFADNDITVSSAINMENEGVGLSLFAGGDVMVNASIKTTNGDITIVADTSGHGNTYPSDGIGEIIFGTNTSITINAGTGSITLTADEDIEVSGVTISPIPTINIREEEEENEDTTTPTFINDFIKLPQETTQQHVC